MDLAGQGKPPVLDTSRGGLDDGGYLMVVLLIGIAVTAVWMGSMLPSWRQQAVREKEAELVFRGEQYARAIALYYRKNQRLPPNIDTLVSQRYLRKKYVDPMTGKEFLPLAAQTGGSPQGAGRQAGPAQSGGVIGVSGVRSTSTDTSIVIYRNQQAYSQFPFDYQQALQRMGVQNQQGAGPAREDGGRGGRGRGDELAPINPGGGRGPRGGGPGGPARGGGGAAPAGPRGAAQPGGGIQTGRGR